MQPIYIEPAVLLVHDRLLYTTRRASLRRDHYGTSPTHDDDVGQPAHNILLKQYSLLLLTRSFIIK